MKVTTASGLRAGGFLILLAAAVALAGCDIRSAPSAAVPPQTPTPTEGGDRALSAAVHFLTARQAPDGAWRSDTYGVFKDGDSLTPLVLTALLAVPPRELIGASSRKGAAYLAAMVRPDGSIDPGPHGLTYPVYTAAGAVIVLSHPLNVEYAKARDAWLAYLRQRQLTEELGWQLSDKEYGGWGYAKGLPRKPEPGQPAPPLTESNLSATVFALEALHAAGCAADDPALAKALTFVRRCQNYDDDPQKRDPAMPVAFDDGGFFFIYDDPVRNKAGSAGKDKAGRERFFSYGSTTADGLRALWACGLSRDHPRVAAARLWLEKNFAAHTHPGAYARDRESNRPAVYYYYCRSLALALKQAGNPVVQTPTGKVGWAAALAHELLKRQEPDGSWINSAVAVREDDPLVATSLAVAALAVCREQLNAGQAQGHVSP